jgi:oxygen-independent coproporphyrinogen-3 oxidase
MDFKMAQNYLMNCPRYTSYPPINLWNSHSSENTANLLSQIENSKTASFYIHFPYCQKLCYYCGCHRFITKSEDKYASYVNYLLKEIGLYTNHLHGLREINEIHFGGGTPSLIAIEDLKRIIDAIKKLSLSEEPKEISIEIDPRSCSPEKLQSIIELGFNRFSFGIQDFDPEVQKAIGRIQSFEQVKSLTDVLRTNGIENYNFDLILGLPLQNKKSITESLEKCLSLKPSRFAAYTYAHLPERLPNQKLIDDSLIPSPEKRWEQLQHFKNCISEAGYKDIGMDHFSLSSDPLYKASLEQKLHRNFMGYTTHNSYPLIGFGLSSISDTKNSYWQNHKEAKDYFESLDRGELPIYKSHQLDAKEQTTKENILSVLCQGKVQKALIDTHSLMDLKNLEEKDLVIEDKDYFYIKNESKDLLRFFASLIDPLFQKERVAKEKNYSTSF